MRVDRPRPDLPTTEKEWMVTITDLLDIMGWTWIHVRPARRSSGAWVTPTSGSGAVGFPDLVAVRPPRVLWIEVKRDGGRASPAQQEWISRLVASGQEAMVLWFPRDWDRFERLVAKDPNQLSWLPDNWPTITSNSTEGVRKWTP